ncbi:replication protein A 70 kDa DNA-binding subunit A-like [Helianthus annuus]|uniref:replication protein A 70 kDa DNA-binding subunit A-like n=1 Tax=Helianthus annuus TaxID=4232 RepID=UPI000B8FF63B|nr:replication protein A 70 kDa DNA-binding subunit A-like [Helianthus annuus]
MENHNIAMLRAVDAFQEQFSVKVRVIRVWEHPERRNPSQLYSFDMIIMDEEGTKMEAACLNRVLPQFRPSLVEKKCLIIRNPTIGFNNSTYRYVDNQNRLCFQGTTEVIPCEDIGGSPYGFDFLSFPDILNSNAISNSTVDVIGYLIRSFPKETVNNKATGKQAVKVTIEISDLEGRTVFLTLWDQYCDKVLSFFESIKGKNIHAIIILQFGKVKWWNGVAYVNNSYTVSRLFCNHDCPEVDEFRNRLFENSIEVSESTSLGSMAKSVEEEILQSKDFLNICDVFSLKTVCKVIVLGNILGVYKDEGWFYEGCNRCNKKIKKVVNLSEDTQESGSAVTKEVLTCVSDRCAFKTITSSLKFKIQLRVQDPSASVTLTLFDREARKLLGKSVDDILTANPEFRSDSMKIPAEVDALVGQTAAFKIDVTGYVLKYNIHKYDCPGNSEVSHILKLTVDPNVISVLQEKQSSSQISSSQNMSLNIDASEFESQTSDGFKNSAAKRIENNTPVSNMASTVSPVSLDVTDTPDSMLAKDEVKRNLVQVYDVEEDSHTSATKLQKSGDFQDFNSAEKRNLLIPKVEK